jgi:hypothetical protein
MNTLRRIPRHMVKALAAGAVLIAAALPMAFATAASAASPPVVTGAFVTGTPLNTAGTITAVTTSATVTLAGLTSAATLQAGDLVVVGTTVVGTLAANTASGATSTTLVSNAAANESVATVLFYAPVSLGEGSNSYPAHTGDLGVALTVLGTGFAFDGGNYSLASGDKDLSFTSVAEASTTSLTAVLTTTASTTFGSENLALTDSGGTSTALAGAITVNPDPAVTAISPNTLADSQVSGVVTITGTFVANTTAGTVAITNVANGTTLTIGTITSATATTITVASVTALNSANHLAATPGAYSVTVTNIDGGPGTLVGGFTVTAAGITNVSPSAIALVTTSVTETVNGFGFQPSAVVALPTCSSAAEVTVVAATTQVISPNVITFQADVSSIATPETCTVTVQNPVSGNDALFTATGALGIGEAGNAVATISAASVSPVASIVPGSTTATPVTMTVTGTGFSPYSTVSVLAGTGSIAATGVSASPCVSSINGDTLTCTVAVATGATAGPDSIEVLSGTGVSSPFPAVLSVAGPAITASAPVAIAVGAPEGTVITLTGTDFNPTATAVVTGSGLVPADYVFADISATSATITLTAPLPKGSNSIVVVLTETIATGVVVSAPPFSIPVDAQPVVTALVNTNTKVDGVGSGAKGASVTISGTGFTTGATIGKFVSVYGVADTGATGTVVSVNTAGTQIIADITLPAADANISDGYTITNTDGGTAVVTAFTTAAITIDSGPTITSVSPATATANSTVAFTITGTGFVTNAAVSSSTPNATCGTATVVLSTSITTSCTFLAAGSTATSLVVTNPDGGSATSAPVLAAVTTTVTPGPKSPHATHVHGFAVTGKTVTITISGTGFYGAPKITSNAKGTTAKVSHDSGKLLTVRISTKAGKGEHTLTIRDADGKSCKINYATK